MIKGSKMFWMFGCWLAKDLSTAQLMFSGALLVTCFVLCFGWFVCWFNDVDVKTQVKYIIKFTLVCGLGFYGVALILGIQLIRTIFALQACYKKFNAQSGVLDNVKVNFETFKNLYAVSKKRFKFNKEWGSIGAMFDQLFYTVDEGDFRKQYRVLIPNVVDFVKFYFWYKNALKECARRKKIKESIKESKAMEDILNQAQKDIDNLRKQSENEIKQATSTMKEVNERLKILDVTS